MSWIFVSHSDVDRDAALEVRARLDRQGYASLFLAIDPEHGIGAGRDWKKVIYHKLKHCSAAILLCSKSSAHSNWCFWESTQTRADEKPLFPLRIDDEALPDHLRDLQCIDLRPDRKEEGYQKLWNALLERRIDPRDSFPWDPTQPPYPGMQALQETDAAVYFGRQREVRDFLSALERLRRGDRARLAVIVGSSGSGKSSLVRAGLIPRLRKDETHWSVYLASPNLGPIPDSANLPAANGGDADAPTVLLVVDQLEEVLGSSANDDAVTFLKWLRTKLESSGPRTLVLATLQANLLGRFLESCLGEVPHQILTLRPMERQKFAEVIEGPAATANVDFDDSLVGTMVDDTQSDDSLPLLAFALRELYERCRDGRFTFEAYNDLGDKKAKGIDGAVGKAANEVMARSTLDESGIPDLRRAFLKMVEFEIDGTLGRRTASWDEIPARVEPVLREFVKARLLTSGDLGEATGGQRNTVRVAHPALFRSWPLYVRWIDGDREFRLWRKRIEPKVGAWTDLDDKAKGLLGDEDLVEGRKWLESRREDLDASDIAFIEASIAKKAAADEVDRKRRVRERSLLVALGVTVIPVSVLALAVLKYYKDADKGRSEALAASQQFHEQKNIADAKRIEAEKLSRELEVQKNQADAGKREAENLTQQVEKQRKAAERTARTELARRLASQAMAGEADEPKRILLACEAINVSRSKGEPPDASAMTALTGLLRQVRFRRLVKFPVPLQGAVLGAEGKRIVGVGIDGSVGVFNKDNPEPLLSVPAIHEASSFKFAMEGTHTSAALSGDGNLLALGVEDGTVRVWNLEFRRQDPRKLAAAKAAVLALAFSAGNRYLAEGGADGQTRVWDLDTNDVDSLTFGADGIPVRAVALSRDGRQIVTGSANGQLRVWARQADTTKTMPKPLSFAGSKRGVFTIWLSPDGKRLVSQGKSEDLCVWNLDAPNDAPLLVKSAAPLLPVLSINLDHGNRLVTGGWFGISIWDLAKPGREWLALSFPTPVAILAAVCSGDGKLLTVVNSDGVAIEYDLGAPQYPQMLTGHEEAVVSLAFSGDGKRIVSGSTDGTVRVWDGGSPRVHSTELTPKIGKVGAVSLTAEGAQFVTGGESARVALWEFARAGPQKQLGECKARAEVMVMTSDGKSVAVGGRDGLYLGEVTPAGVSFRRLPGHAGPVRAIAMTPDGKTVASGSADGVTRVWALASSADSFRELPGHKGAVSALAMTPDGQTIATGGEDLTLRVWDLSNPSLMPALDDATHSSPINSLAFGPHEGRFRLASASLDTIACWDSLSLDVEPILLDWAGTGALSLRFAPDGNRLAAGTQTGDIYVWELRLETLFSYAKRNVGRNFTREEWHEFFPNTEYRKTFDFP